MSNIVKPSCIIYKQPSELLSFAMNVRKYPVIADCILNICGSDIFEYNGNNYYYIIIALEWLLEKRATPLSQSSIVNENNKIF